MSKPKVSVVITGKNVEKTIAKAIESIQDQSLKDWELIVVDDASTDNTYSILSGIQKKDKRIKILRNKVNKERCVSRNLAIEEANGDYIAVLDGDDYALPTRLAKESVYLDTHPNCYLVGARTELIDEDGNKIGESWGLGFDGDITEHIKEQNRLVHSSIMFRNKKEFWYRDNMRFAEDYDLFMQMVCADKEIHILQEILVKYTTKKDLVYNEYLINQKYTQEAIKYWYKQKKENYKDIYDSVDRNNLKKYASKTLIYEMKMKQAFFSNDFKKARKYAGKLININPASEWRLYYIDTFFRGNIIKFGKWIKRRLV